MHPDELREVLAERMARPAAPYEPLITGGDLEIDPQSMDDAQVRRVLDSHALMAAYALQASKKPLHAESVASEFFGQYTKLLSESLPESENLLWDAYFAVVALYAIHFGTSISETIANLREFFEIFGGSPPQDRPKCTDGSFWPLVEALLVGLEVGEALDVLNRGFEGADLDKQVFDTVSELANTLKQYPGLVANSTQQQFWDFRRAVLAVLDRANTLPLPWGPAIARVCSILSGRHESAARHWTQSVASRYAYLNPDQQEWPCYVQEVSAAKPALDGDAPDWECAVARAMDGHIYSAILNLHRLDTCSAVVAAEFYFRTNRLHQPFPSSPSLREYLGLTHALECLAVPGLVTTGVDMLINMETPYSREILAAALPQLGLEAPETREYVLQLTRELNLPEARTAFQIKVAEYEMARRNYVQAIKSYYDAGDLRGMRDTTWAAFEAMLVSGVVDTAYETALVLRSDPDAALPKPVQECIAPLALLTTVLDNSESGSSHSIDFAVQSLVSASWVPSKYYPLIIACAQQVVDEATLAAMMRALQQCETSSDAARDQGIELLARGREVAPWAHGIDPAYSNDEVLKMLCRKLSESYI